MDTTKAPIKNTITNHSASDMEAARNIVRQAIRKNSQCFRADISRQNNERVSEECLTAAISQMIRAKEIRQKEDTQEHDWEYIFRRPSA